MAVYGPVEQAPLTIFGQYGAYKLVVKPIFNLTVLLNQKLRRSVVKFQSRDVCHAILTFARFIFDGLFESGDIFKRQ